MDITPYASAIVAAIIAAGATYATTLSRISKLEVRMESVERQQGDSRALSNQIAALAAKVDSLREDVGKHNRLIERTYQIEADIKVMRERQDELHDDMLKIGGSK